jgi:hypothetical protein
LLGGQWKFLDDFKGRKEKDNMSIFWKNGNGFHEDLEEESNGKPAEAMRDMRKQVVTKVQVPIGCHHHANHQYGLLSPHVQSTWSALHTIRNICLITHFFLYKLYL